MSFLAINGAQIFYEEVGHGPQTVVFSHGLLWSSYMFKNQMAVLKDRYRCVAYDHRGQGQSEVTESGYDLKTLYKDAVAIIEALNCAPCHFVGLSMGGFVGLRLALWRPDLLKSLILIESYSEPEAEANKRRYQLLSVVGRLFGLRVVADPVMNIMFGRKFLNDPGREDLRNEWRERFIGKNRTGIVRALAGVIKRSGVTEQLHSISVPTLIIVGDQDVPANPAKAKKMHAEIPDSELVIIPNAGHTSTVEEPEAVNAAILDFLEKQGG